MTRKERAAQKFILLKEFIPHGSFDRVIDLLSKQPVFLRVTRERKSILGDYRAPTDDQPVHRISVNGSLNKYSFLITLLHEIAHLQTYVAFQNNVAPHGVEWQRKFKEILLFFLDKNIFPKKLETEIYRSLERVRASTCSDPDLFRALKAYDVKDEKLLFVEEIPPEARFKTSDGRKFKMIEKLRTRYRCIEIKTGNVYLFNALMEVERLK